MQNRRDVFGRESGENTGLFMFFVGGSPVQDKRPYPFKRNRFYPGKLLSSYDFLIEQRYFADKHRFINRALFGAGVICGMRVYKIDDFSIMIESGFALDFDGREIVMEKDEVKRLSTIDGFSKTASGRLSLYICYSEEQVTPVFAVDKQEQGEKLEYNHIAEGYRLLVSDSSGPEGFEAEPDFIIKQALMRDGNYLIALEAPRYACRSLTLRPAVTVTKLSAEDAGISFSAELQAPAFKFSGEEKGKLQFEIKPGELKPGESVSRYVELIPTGTLDEASIFIEAGQASAVSGGNTLELREDIRIPIRIGDMPPHNIIRGAVSRIPPENLFGSQSSGLKLAEISVVRSGESCIINSVGEAAFNISGTPLQQKYYDEYEKFYSRIPPKPVPQAQATEIPAGLPPVYEKDISTGVVEIPIGMKTRTGEVCYSGHIIHQLGPGNVFVSAGLESIKLNEAKEASQLTVYGDTSLFRDVDIPVQTAVCVDATRGTFRIAVRLLEQINSIFLTMRWVAVRLPEAERYAMAAVTAKKRLYASPATKALSPKEKWAIRVEFEGMPPATCRFEVMEPGGGSVTSDGVYTAPGAEGVYDIKISAADEPNLTAYAYAVVRRKED